MNTCTQPKEQVPCIKLIHSKIFEEKDHTFTLFTHWEDQCHHQYVELFHDNGDDARGVWTECIEHLPSLQHAAAEIKIQEAEHARQGGYTDPDECKVEEVITGEWSPIYVMALGAIIPAILFGIVMIIIG